MVLDSAHSRVYVHQHLPQVLTSSLVADIWCLGCHVPDGPRSIPAWVPGVHHGPSAFRAPPFTHYTNEHLIDKSFQLFYNIILLCLGRHPVQNPHMIKPEIGKLPKSIVDRIPLVVYIPPPPDEDPEAGSPKVPAAIYNNMTYPPKPKAAAPKRRFAFLRKLKRSGTGNGNESGGKQGGNSKDKSTNDGGEPLTWEENWEAGEHPFVRLEGNRAVCAICLMDFEEPKKRGGLSTAEEVDETPAVPEITDVSTQKVPVEERIQEEVRSGDGDVDALKLEDAGEGAQPLRLLACGHVFHVSLISSCLLVLNSG